MPSETGRSQSLSMQPRLTIAEAIDVVPDVRRHYDVLLPDLEAFYWKEGHDLSDADLFLAIDLKFGPRLTREVCLPLGFFQGACAFIGMVILRQSDRRQREQPVEQDRRTH